MKKKICVVTGTRAEYGLLRPLISKLNKDELFELIIIATGMHLSEAFGNTYQEIEKDGYRIGKKIEALADDDSKSGMAKAIGRAIISFTEYFEQNRPDMLIVLGDRYEIYAASLAAAVLGITISHIHGGELTQGAIDDVFRHSISKMSTLHFTAAKTYRERVIQLGENPDYVYNVGALGVENILTLPLLTKEELSRQLDLNLEQAYGLVTFHPETKGDNEPMIQLEELFQALENVRDMNFIFTKANSDAFGRKINEKIDEYVSTHKNAVAFVSMGVLRYLSAMKYASMVIGNSSSGILETPIFKIPTINIGDRQKGRELPSSVINCSASRDSILQAMNLAQDKRFLSNIQYQESIFGDGTTSDKIVKILHDYYK